MVPGPRSQVPVLAVQTARFHAIQRAQPRAQDHVRREREARAPEDVVTVSPEARRLEREGWPARAEAPDATRPEPDPADEATVAELQRRDAQVRAHEAAHQAAGGAVAGAASFSYQLGPDGRLYAVGGEVPVLLRRGSTPGETIAIAQRVRSAALAPADPSAQDLAVAAAATAMEAEARAEQANGRRGPGRAARGGRPARREVSAYLESPPQPDPI